MGQSGQELVQFLLTVGQLAAAAVVDAEAVHDAVDDEEAEGVGGEGEGEGVEELELVLGCAEGRENVSRRGGGRGRGCGEGKGEWQGQDAPRCLERGRRGCSLVLRRGPLEGC